jgi:transposase
VVEVSPWLGVSQHSLYQWIKAGKMFPDQLQAQGSQADEMRRMCSSFPRRLHIGKGD